MLQAVMSHVRAWDAASVRLCSGWVRAPLDQCVDLGVGAGIACAIIMCAWRLKAAEGANCASLWDHQCLASQALCSRSFPQAHPHTLLALHMHALVSLHQTLHIAGTLLIAHVYDTATLHIGACLALWLAALCALPAGMTHAYLCATSVNA